MVHTIEVEVLAAAAPSVVYALLRDGAGWPTWSPLGSFELERPGETEREGVGAIRVFRTGPLRSRERIVELVRDRRLAYVLESGLPIRDYLAQVDLEPRDGGTVIRWRSTFGARVPLLGRLVHTMLDRFIRRLVAGLAAAAEDRSGPRSMDGHGR
ncbi:SRPBCC family protein [Allokutzneria sp. A3M-2-11 16]|uniref:SRPBCC family protein n=1 Tax=Allokutzneria sp. A3M-2-11 16 TaxID=2962043 RepID=UPI0020B7EC89|nr:SRPBCC family protein [Allokutzneria sp. A3M-2-11 16]MCP3801078.1 SRPBCC family protein [Allokutzneria sp. A3M-2-11 16]